MVALIKRHRKQEREILKTLPRFFALLINSNINTLNQHTVDSRSNASASIENRGRTSFFESPDVFLMFFYLTKFGRNGSGSIENRSRTAWFSGPMTNFTSRGTFLDASLHLCKRPCPSVGWSVTLSSKSMKNGLLRNLNDADGAGRGRKRDEEEGETRRKE